MQMKLMKRPSQPYSRSGTAGVYAYEAALDWFSLDPNSPYRGLDGARRIVSELASDYNDDGKFELGRTSTPDGGNTTWNYVPNAPRLQVTPDSVITYNSFPAPGGSVEVRHAAPRH